MADATSTSGFYPVTSFDQNGGQSGNSNMPYGGYAHQLPQWAGGVAPGLKPWSPGYKTYGWVNGRWMGGGTIPGSPLSSQQINAHYIANGMPATFQGTPQDYSNQTHLLQASPPYRPPVFSQPAPAPTNPKRIVALSGLSLIHI